MLDSGKSPLNFRSRQLIPERLAAKVGNPKRISNGLLALLALVSSSLVIYNEYDLLQQAKRIQSLPIEDITQEFKSRQSSGEARAVEFDMEKLLMVRL